MQPLAIIGLCIGSAVLYGIVHDQITARICVEYFTIGHPPVFPTSEPTLLGIGWGIIATWWVGLLLGIPLAIASRAGKRPPRTAASLFRPIGILLSVMAVCAFTAGVVGWILGSRGLIFLTGHLANSVPPEKHVPFLVDAWAHLASYAGGFFGGAILIAHVWRSRKH